MSLSAFQVLFTAIALLLATLLIAIKVILETKRDLHPIALAEQANVASTRKEKETAVYRNFTVPPGFPLTTGMGLSLGYRLRNGNFGDLWSSIMEMGETSYVELNGSKFSLATLNGEVKQILTSFKHSATEPKHIGICIPPTEHAGFVLAIAGLMGSLQNVVPVFMPSVPRSKQDLQIIAVDSWETVRQMGDSCQWYETVIVCDVEKSEPTSSNQTNVITWKQLMLGCSDDNEFKYTPPQDNSDDMKVMALSKSSFGSTTSFTHMALVSSVAAFIKSFPLHHELSSHDHISVILDNKSTVQDPIQIFPKVLATLLHGGSASIQSHSPSETLERCLNRDTTLLQISDTSSLLDSQLMQPLSMVQRFKFAVASNFLSEGVFTSSALISVAFKKLRCVYLYSPVKDVKTVSLMTLVTSKPVHDSIKKTRPTKFLNRMRALLGCRVVVELYCPFLVLGPIAATNYFDYRVLPAQADSKVTNYGPICTSLEAKLVEDDSNQTLNITKRQGLLCLRGFTIGKPMALDLAKKFDGGEGWMPLPGVICLWGQDGCLYEYK
ncbi:LAFA_0E12288g1_1 [Lachancea sp. 'fantastica']|nr:LAFA_0E12288g1_1 [Lachancea sp. 'fantastica']